MLISDGKDVRAHKLLREIHNDNVFNIPKSHNNCKIYVHNKGIQNYEEITGTTTQRDR